MKYEEFVDDPVLRRMYNKELLNFTSEAATDEIINKTYSSSNNSVSVLSIEEAQMSMPAALTSEGSFCW